MRKNVKLCNFFSTSRCDQSYMIRKLSIKSNFALKKKDEVRKGLLILDLFFYRKKLCGATCEILGFFCCTQSG